MGYWKSKVLPKIQKVFGKDATKKTAAAEACKSFNESQEEISKEFEEKKAELQPKVVEILETSSTEIKTLVKEPKEAGLKKHSDKVQKFLDELVKIEFPGSKAVCEASSQYGPALVAGPITFIFEKISTFVVTEEKTREVEVPAPPPAETTTIEETTVVEEETAAEVADKPEEEAVAEPEKPAEAEPPKVEEPQAEQTPKV